MATTCVWGSIEELLAGRCGRAAAPGDVLAFSGTSGVDRFIQKATVSDISHVAILIRHPADGQTLSVLEATGAGVTVTPLEQSLDAYRRDHTCFFLPLAEPLRHAVVPAALAAYYAANADEKYNYAGVAAAGLYEIENPLFHLLMDHVGQRFEVPRVAKWWAELGERLWDTVYGIDPHYRRLFCSQLVTAALQAVGVVPAGPPNARLVVPVEVCRFEIYAPSAYQLNGAALLEDPFRWGASPLLAGGDLLGPDDEMRP
jgi:hypothetical protein